MQKHQMSNNQMSKHQLKKSRFLDQSRLWPIKMALTYIFDTRREKWISISAMLASCGLFLGVITLIVVFSVMQGFKNNMLDKILQIQGHVTIYGNIYNKEEIVDRVKKTDNVLRALPVLEKQFMAMHDKNAFGILTHGLSDADLKKNLDGKIVAGNISNLKEENTICIGQRLASDMNIKLGDTITLISAESIETPFGNAPRMQPFKVAAIFSFGFHQYDKMLCIMNLSSLQSFMDQENMVSSVLLFLKQPEESHHLITDMQNYQELQGLSVIKWQDNNATFAQVLTMQRNVMFIVISMMILIASFNGVSSLLMLVKERSKEIAILRVLGATKQTVMKIFLFIGLFIGTFSVICGVLFGVILAKYLDHVRLFIEYIFGVSLFPQEFYHLSSMPVYLDYMQIFYIGCWCVVLSLLSILYPCLKVLKIEPDAELRY